MSGVHLSMPYMSQRDRNDILFGIEQGFDLISASFTRNAQDIMEIRHLLDEHDCNMRIIAKIENQEGIDNIDEILTVADGIMVARGDMGVEIDFAEIPAIQKHLIDRAMSAGKICITATQMLDSMMVNPRPHPWPRSPTWPTPSMTVPALSCCPARPLPASIRWRPSRPWPPSPRPPKPIPALTAWCTMRATTTLT